VGLAAFLVAHLLNLKAFCSLSSEGEAPPLRLDLALMFGIFVASMLSLLFIVGPGSAGTMLRSSAVLSIAVPIYGCVLGSCPWRALARRGAFENECSELWTVAGLGYCIYAVSDTCLSISRFSASIREPIRTILVIGTYWGGQLLISVACDVREPEASVLWPFIRARRPTVTAAAAGVSNESREEVLAARTSREALLA